MNKKSKKSPFTFAIVAVGLSWIIYCIIVKLFIKDISNAGAFGDIFGGLNAIFSGLTLFGIYYTITLTRSEKDQRQFEEHYFLLLKTIQNITSETYPLKPAPGKHHLTTPEDYQQGRVIIQELASDLKYRLRNSNKKGNVNVYKNWSQKQSQPTLDHYYRLLNTTLKYIDQSNLIDANQKHSYINLLKAQISNHELTLILYHNLLQDQTEIKLLIEKYSLLEHINLESDLCIDLTKYETSAFGSNNQLLNQYNKNKFEEHYNLLLEKIEKIRLEVQPSSSALKKIQNNATEEPQQEINLLQGLAFDFKDHLDKHKEKESIDIYKNWHETQFNSILESYYKQLHDIVKHIDQWNFIDTNQKHSYTNDLKRKISNHELTLILYHSLLPNQTEIKSLIEKYGLFRHIHIEDINHKDLTKYKIDAFDTNEKLLEQYKKNTNKEHQ